MNDAQLSTIDALVVAANGDINIKGGGGGYGIRLSPSAAQAGAGGSSYYTGMTAAGINGYAESPGGYGGGGAGGRGVTTSVGGSNGANGVVMIVEYY